MNTNSDKIDFTRTIYEIRRHWMWFLISFLLIVGSAAYYWRSKSPVYAIHSSMLIEQESNKASGGMAAMMKSFSMGSLGGGSVDDELAVFQSRSLMESTIRELGLNYDYKTRRGLRNITLYDESPIRISAAPAIVDTLQKPIKFKIRLHDGKADIKVKKGIFNTAFDKKGLTLPAEVKLKEGIFLISTTEKYSAKDDIEIKATVTGTAKMAEDIGKIYWADVSSLKANAIEFNYEDDCIKRGKDLLNTIMRIFNERRLEEEFSKARQEVDFIDNRLNNLATDLATSEDKIEAYKTANNMTDIETEAKVLLEQTSANKASIVGLQTQLAIFDMICEFLEDPSNRYSMIPVTSGVDYESAAKSIESYNTLILERMKLDMSAKSDNRALQTLNKQIDGMRQAVVETMQKARQSAEIAYTDFVREDSKYAVRLNQLPSHERKFYDLFRDRTIKNNLYIFLLEQRENNALKLGKSQMGRIVDYAYNDIRKVAPRGSIILSIAFLVSMFLPALFLVFKASRMKRVMIANDFNKLGLPVTCEFATDTDNDTQTYRVLRNTIIGNGKTRSVLICSVGDIDIRSIARNLTDSLIAIGRNATMLDAGQNAAEQLISPDFISTVEATEGFAVVSGAEITREVQLTAIAPKIDTMVLAVRSGELTSNIEKAMEIAGCLKERTTIVLIRE